MVYKEESSTVAIMVSGGEGVGQGLDHVKEMVRILDIGRRELTKGWRWMLM